MALDFEILGEGVYTPRVAARLVGTNTQNVLRWTRGSGPKEPLWRAYFNALDDSRELSFADLTELRVVVSMRKAGLSLQSIRFAIGFAQNEFGLTHALSSARFKTDGRTILLDAVGSDAENTLISLKKGQAGQRVFKNIVEQSLLDLEYEGDRPIRWRPRKFTGVIIDPTRFFGDPILDEFGVSTAMLAKEMRQFDDLSYLSEIYRIPKNILKQALKFEADLDSERSV